MDKLFEIRNLKCSYDKPYSQGRSKVVLHIDDMVLPKGKKIFIVGESGIGKSTILEVLGLMNNTIVPDPETVFNFYGGDGAPIDLVSMWKRGSDRELSDFRRRHFNFIFQSTNLMRNFTAYENVSITRMLQGYSQEESFDRASHVLEALGLGHIDSGRMVQELSGGQQQRLAFARAIIPEFTVLFGDEPTGNLDGENAVRAMELLAAKLTEYKGSSAIIVSHDMHLAVLFGDLIIKVNKLVDEKCGADEITFHGQIDGTCAYMPSADRTEWSNGIDIYGAAEFEAFLRKRQ